MTFSAGLAAGWPGFAVLALLIVTSLTRDVRAQRIGVAAAALAWLISAVQMHAWLAAGGAAVLLAINLLRYGLLVVGDRRVRFTEDEETMASGVLWRMARRDARHFLDQGTWISGKAGEVLTREGEPVSHLFYLAEGTASVRSGGRQVATCRPHHFVGEMTVLSKGAATATVTLDRPARFWCVSAEALRRVLDANPELYMPLEEGIAANLKEKLILANAEVAAARERT